MVYQQRLRMVNSANEWAMICCMATLATIVGVLVCLMSIVSTVAYLILAAVKQDLRYINEEW